MVAHRQNMSIDEKVYADFCILAEKKGIKVSTWVTVKMREFIEDEKLLEEIKKNEK